MSKKLFITSDVHGFYTELMAALNEAGFDRRNEAHYFVSVGDLFDRGCENALVYNFVKGLERKILIRGNHEDMLCEVLDCGISTSRERDNGADITITQLIGEDAIDENGRIDTALYAGKIREIKDFVASMSDYYEADGYVFTHGWLPVVFEGRYPSVNEAWRDASKGDWEYAHTLEWQQLYDVRAMLRGKTIVCGHRPSYLGYMFDGLRERDCILPFYGEGMIAIDANTAKSGKVNVLVIEVPEN